MCGITHQIQSNYIPDIHIQGFIQDLRLGGGNLGLYESPDFLSTSMKLVNVIYLTAFNLMRGHRKNFSPPSPHLPHPIQNYSSKILSK